MRPASRSHDHGRHYRDARREHRSARPPHRSASPSKANGEGEHASGYATVPGAELPTFVYASVLAAFGWIMLASWMDFAADTDAALALGISDVLAVVFFALPIVLCHTGRVFARQEPDAPREFLTAPVETATGPLSGASAWLQVLIIPLALALAATLIGGVNVLVR